MQKKGLYIQYVPYFNKTIEGKFFQVGTDGEIVMRRLDISWETISLRF